ncbi:MAG: hypothetical protein J0H49_12465 [Acidobacteria bacterium]|nr:hypothetical protein [Acidobacteriota bacterium]
MTTSNRTPISARFSEAQVRVLCYLLGPLSGALLLHLRTYGAAWPVRFHAIHSILLTAVWGIGWGLLRFVEEITPWILSTFAREMRLAMNLGFIVAWICLLIAAYQGRRCAVVPFVHRMAARFARRGVERLELKHSGSPA